MARAGLTTARVIAEAAAEADLNGWETLSFAAVAARLDVRLPSLYKHVDSLAALRVGVATLAANELAEALSPAVMGKSGSDCVASLAHAYRAFAKAHPGRYAATLRAPAPHDEAHVAAAARVLAIVAAAVAGYGLADDAGVHAIRGLRAQLHGFVAIEAAGGFAMPQDLDVSFDLLVRDMCEVLTSRAT